MLTCFQDNASISSWICPTQYDTKAPTFCIGSYPSQDDHEVRPMMNAINVYAERARDPVSQLDKQMCGTKFQSWQSDRFRQSDSQFRT